MTAPTPSRRLLAVPAPDTLTTDPQVHVGRGVAATVVIGVSGEIDLATGPSVEARVLAAVDSAPGGRVVLDLNAVGFLGLRGVAMLRAAADRARATGASLVVRAPPWWWCWTRPRRRHVRCGWSRAPVSPWSRSTCRSPTRPDPGAWAAAPSSRGPRGQRGSGGAAGASNQGSSGIDGSGVSRTAGSGTPSVACAGRVAPR